MKKRILSVVLALVMVFSMVPTTAFAATAMQLKKTSKVLYLNEDNKTNTGRTYDFAVINKPVGYKTKYSFTWSSEDTGIATIADSGIVTAEKVGRTTITCTIRSKATGKHVAELKATVTVKENAKTVSITNAFEGSVLNVGEIYQFKCSQKGASGRTSTDKREWVVSDDSIGTFDAAGLFHALKPGETTIQVKTYQSAETKSAGYTAESEPVTIVVLGDEAPDSEARTARPVISSRTGDSFTESCPVTITCATEGATIYYTTDGNAPSMKSKVYNDEISLSESTVIRAFAVSEDLGPSSVSTALFRKVLAISGTASIVGTAEYGETLVVNTSGIMMPTGKENTGSFFYQWQRDGHDIDVGDGLSSSYTLTGADIRSRITCTVSHSDFDGKIIATLPNKEEKVEKADAHDVTAPATILMENAAEKAYTFPLSALSMPQDAGALSYLIGEPSTELFSVPPHVDAEDGGILCFTSDRMAAVGKTATVTVTVQSENYKDAAASLSFSITDKRFVSISGVSVEDRVYNGTAITPVGTPSASYGEAPAQVSGYDYAWYDAYGEQCDGAPTNAGDYKLTVSVMKEDPTYFGSVDVPFTIRPKPITITGLSATKAYDGTTGATLSGGTLSGVVAADEGEVSFDASAVTAVYDSKDVGTNKAITITITDDDALTGEKAENYILSQPTGVTGSITAKAITPAVAVANGTYAYTGSPITPSVTVKDGGITLMKDTDYTVMYANNTNAGTASVTIGAVAGGNYTFADTTETFTIAQADTVTGSYTVSANNSSKFVYRLNAIEGAEYGMDDFAMQSSNEFDGIEPESTHSFQIYVDQILVAAGSVTFSKLDNGNAPSLRYAVSAESGDRTITITPVEGAEYSFDGGTTWGADNSKTNISDDALTIAIRYQETAVHKPSAPISAEVDLNDTTPSIAFAESNVDKVYGDRDFVITPTVANIGGALTYTTDNQKIAQVDDAGRVHIVGAGTVIVKAEFSDAQSDGEASAQYTLHIAPAALTVKADDKTMFAGAEKPTYTATATGLVNGDTITDITYTGDDHITHKGSYTITPAGGTISSGNGNYTITYTAGTLTVTVDGSGIDAAVQAAEAAADGVAVDDGLAADILSGTKFVSPETMTALMNAIAAAEAAKDSVSTAEDLQAAIEALNQAVADFNDSIQTGTMIVYTVDVSAAPVSGGTVSGGGSYRAGAGVTVEAEAKSGYRFVRWTENDTNISTSPSYTIQNISANRALVAEFEVDTPATHGYVAFESANSFTLSVSDKQWDGRLMYSIDGTGWDEWNGLELTAGKRGDTYAIYLRGYDNTIISGSSSGRFVLTGSSIACRGNIENLLNCNVVKAGEHPEMQNNCYHYLFQGCTALTAAPALPATTLAFQCYAYMFDGCTALTAAPALPATTLANNCYAYMFRNCTSLTAAPALSATTLASSCYANMFNGCTALTAAPQLPATSLATFCYDGMFNGCTALATATALPAMTLATACYHSTFQGCTALTAAPELPATALANNCYNNMFNGCTALTTAPELPATALANNCYNNMFNGCTALTTAPELPATTLAEECYSGMFRSCTALTSAPELPATTLATQCYSVMFSGCTGIAISAKQTDDYCIPWRISTEGATTNAQNWNRNMLSNTGGPFKTNPNLGVTYYQAKPKAAAPVIAPNGGAFTGSVSVTITCDTEGAAIYYTTDGTEPTASSTKYENAITLTDSATVKAIAVKGGMTDSEVTSAAFTKNTPALGGNAAINGTAKCGETLRVDTGNITGSSGMLLYQWMSGNETVSDQAEYTLAASDIGKTIACIVTDTVSTGSVTATLDSVVAKADGPAAPTVTGSYAVSTADSSRFVYTVSSIEGAEYSKDSISWQDSNVFDGIVPASTVTFYARCKETADAQAGTAGSTGEVTFDKLENPAVPTLNYAVSGEIKNRTVTITPVDGAEYRFGDDEWGNTSTKSGLVDATITVQIRYAATATMNASTATGAAIDLGVFSSISASLGEDISLTYYIARGDFAKVPRMRFTINGHETMVEGMADGEQYAYKFTGIAPQWMGDPITAELLDENGTVIGTKEYSVLQYLNKLKTATAGDLKYSKDKYNAMILLVNDLLIYGGAAQTYTGYKTNALVSEGITGSTFTALTETDTDKSFTNNGTYVTFSGMTVNFNSVNRLKFRFTAEDLTGVTFKVKVGDGAEEEIGHEKVGDDYIITTDGIKATGFDDVYTIIAYKDDVAGATASYSVKSYVNAMQDAGSAMAALARATYNYGLSAKAFVPAP